MKTEIIRDWERFGELEPEWNDLLASSRSDAIFLRWEWIRSWRRVLLDRIPPFVVVVRDREGALAGVAPFFRTQYRLVRVLPYTVLRILGDYPTGAECLDWILRSGSEEDAARCIVKALAETEREWDFVWMRYVPHWTGGKDRIRNASAEGGLYVAGREVEFGAMSLPETLDGLLASFGASHRYNTRRDLKRTFAKDGTKFLRCGTEEEIPRYLDSLFALHGLRWGREGQSGTFRKKPNEAEFYRNFSLDAFRRNWLALYGVEISGELKAIQFGYIYNGVYLQMQEGFDQECGRGLGNLLRLKVMEDLMAQGVRSYDFLAEMSEHKKRWHVTERKGSHLMIGNRKWKNSPLFRFGVWPTGKYLTHGREEMFRGRSDAR